MKQAVIDIGTNTCLLLIAESDRAGKMNVIADAHAIARLGAGVDKTKHIPQESYERLRKILLDHQKIIVKNNTAATVAIATSAMRDAENRDVIISEIQKDTGVEIDLLSGSDESIWSYRGAICGLKSKELEGPLATLDIGGGSTELSIGLNGTYIKGSSINIGAVRIKERFLSSNDDSSVRSAREFILTQIQNSFSEIKTDKLIAVAGTPTALTAMKLRLQTFDAQKVNGTILTLTELSSLVQEILSLSQNDLLKKYPVIHPDRADILPSGALILEEIVKFLQLKEVRVSTFGLRYGIMIREFEKQMKSESKKWAVTHE